MAILKTFAIPMLFASSCLLLLLLPHVANAGVTFYSSRAAFMEALTESGATLVENVAYSAQAQENVFLPFAQCSLTFPKDEEKNPHIMQVFGPEFNNKLYDTFGGNYVYATGDMGNITEERGVLVETSHEFFAMGFDAGAQARGDWLGIKIPFSAQTPVFEHPITDLNAGNPATFFGWISSDKNAVANGFELGAGPSNTHISDKLNMRFTNIVYATFDATVRDKRLVLSFVLLVSTLHP